MLARLPALFAGSLILSAFLPLIVDADVTQPISGRKFEDDVVDSFAVSANSPPIGNVEVGIGDGTSSPPMLFLNLGVNNHTGPAPANEVPAKLSYQGRLLNADGTPVTKATFDEGDPDRPLIAGFTYTGDPNTFPAQSFFDIFTEIDLPASNGSTGGPASLKHFVVDATGPSVFAIDALVGDIGDNTNDALLHLELTIPTGQNLQFTPPSTSAPTDFPAQSFFDIFTELSLDGPLNPNLPMFEVTASLPEPTSLAFIALAGAGLLARRKR